MSTRHKNDSHGYIEAFRKNDQFKKHLGSNRNKLMIVLPFYIVLTNPFKSNFAWCTHCHQAKRLRVGGANGYTGPERPNE